MEIYIHAKHVLNKLLQPLLFLIIPFAAFAQQKDIPVINSHIEGIVVDSVT